MTTTRLGVGLDPMRDFATVQEALDFVAANSSMDELMSRRPEYPRKDIRFVIKINRADRIAWQHNADKRAERREDSEE